MRLCPNCNAQTSDAAKFCGGCGGKMPAGQSQLRAEDVAEGTVIADRYRVDHGLGHGETGQVWQAWDVQAKRQVTIKVLPRVISDSPGAMEALQKAAQVALQLDHPVIAKLHSLETSP